MPNFSVGVDMGGTNLRIAAVSSEGQLLEKIGLATNSALGADAMIHAMCDAIVRLSEKFRSGGEFLGAGIGIPGIIDLEAGVVRKSANVPCLTGYPVRERIEQRLGARILLDNDAKLAAIGEQWLGAARGVDDMALLTLGTGIGGAIVLNGKIFHGMNGMAGEFGHVTIERDGVPCGCGNRGCAERYASASALVRMAREMIESGNAPELAKAANADPDFGAKAIYELAMKGDAAAQQMFCRFGRALGILLADIVNVLNVPVYVIGGGVASAWDAFAPKMFEELRARSLIYSQTEDETNPAGRKGEAAPSSSRRTRITRAALGGDAGLFGGARLPLL